MMTPDDRCILYYLSCLFWPTHLQDIAEVLTIVEKRLPLFGEDGQGHEQWEIRGEEASPEHLHYTYIVKGGYWMSHMTKGDRR